MRYILAVLLCIVSLPASAQRFLGGPPGEQLVASAVCNSSTIGGVAAFSDANTAVLGAQITAGGGINHVFAVCEKTGVSTQAWLVTTANGSGTAPPGSSGQFPYNNAGAWGAYTLSGDVAINPTTGVSTVATFNGGTPFGTLAGASNVNLATQATGNLPVANLNSGTGASASTYWRGDGVWSPVSGSVPIGILGIDVTTLGFAPGGTVDNGPLVAGLNTAINTATSSGALYAPVAFPYDPTKRVSTYVFSQPLDLWLTASVKCGDGSKASSYARTVLAFQPGVPGVQFHNSTAAAAFGYPTGPTTGWGVWQGNLSGCVVLSLGLGQSSGAYGSANFVVPSMATGPINNNNQDTNLPNPQLWSIGDGIFAIASGEQKWTGWSGNIPSGTTTMTVTGTPAPYFAQSGEPGLAVGQLLTGTNVLAGTYISGSGNSGPGGTAATCAGAVACTGTGGAGTYLVNQAPTSTATANAAFEQHLGPAVPMGTTITGCQVLSGTYQCTYGGGKTMTASNTSNIGHISAVYMLPGPHASAPATDQHYTMTNSTSGGIYGPLTVTSSLNSATYNFTALGGATPTYGQIVIGTGGSPVTTTTTGNIAVGDYNNIAVTDCTGVNPGMWVVGFNGGNPIFPPGTGVTSCTAGVLTVTGGMNSNATGWTGQSAINSNNGVTTADLTSGSTTLQNVALRFMPINSFFVGMAVTGANIPAGTKVVSWSVDPYPSGTYYNTARVVLSQAPTGSATGQAVTFGGALQAVSSGATLTFLSGAGTITACPSGTCGGTGNYTLDDTSHPALSGATLYVYDTSAHVYLTGGPRPIYSGQFLFAEGVPFGTTVLGVWGTSPTAQTVILGTSDLYQTMNATVSHPGRTGSLWVLPESISRDVQGDTYGNTFQGFPVAMILNCQGGGGVSPSGGCGHSTDKENYYSYSAIGRYAAGNNGGSIVSMSEQFDHNYYCDTCDLLTVRASYYGPIFQSIDESTSSQDWVLYSSQAAAFYSPYASGSGRTQTAPAGRMLGMPLVANPGTLNVFGTVWDVPADATIVGSGNGSISCPSGVNAATMRVVGGIVTHC